MNATHLTDDHNDDSAAKDLNVGGAVPCGDLNAPAALRGRRNLAIIAAGVFVTLGIIGYFIYSETPRHEPIVITAPWQYLPNDTSTVLYMNGKALFSGIEQYKTTNAATGSTAAAASGDVPASTSASTPSADPDALFAGAGAQTVAGVTLLDQVKGLREVEHVLIAASRQSLVPAVVVAPFRDPDALMSNLRSLPGFSSSSIIVDEESGWPVMQVKLAWQKLLYLSAAEKQFLFAGDGSYFLKTLRGFQRPVKAASFQGGPIEPLLSGIRPGTILSVVQVVSFTDDLEGQFNALEESGDPSSMAFLRSIEELGASLRHMQAIRLDVWRREGDGALMVEAALLFSRPEFGEAFQRNVDQARNAVTVVAGIFLPREVGAAFTDLAAGFASPLQTDRVVTLTIADSPKQIDAFLSAMGAWLEGRMNFSNFLGAPAAP